MNKECPLRVISGREVFVDCIKEACAWWVSIDIYNREYGCAIVALAMKEQRNRRD